MATFLKKSVMQDSASAVPAFAKVLQKCRTLADGSVMLEVSDNEFTMKALFARDSWQAADRRFKDSMSSPPSVEQGDILLKMYKSIFQSAEDEENEEANARFLLYVQDFMVTDFLKTYRCKRHVPYIMSDAEVCRKAVKLTEFSRKQPDSNSQSLSASQLIMEMGKPSLEEDSKPKYTSASASREGSQRSSGNGWYPQHEPHVHASKLCSQMPMWHQDSSKNEADLFSRLPEVVLCAAASVTGCSELTSLERQSRNRHLLLPLQHYQNAGELDGQMSESLFNPRPLQKRCKITRLDQVPAHLQHLTSVKTCHTLPSNTCRGSPCNYRTGKDRQHDVCQHVTCKLPGGAIQSQGKRQGSPISQRSCYQQLPPDHQLQASRHQKTITEREEWEKKVGRLLNVLPDVLRLLVSQHEQAVLDSLPEWTNDNHGPYAQENLVGSSAHPALDRVRQQAGACESTRLFVDQSTLKSSDRSCLAPSCHVAGKSSKSNNTGDDFSPKCTSSGKPLCDGEVILTRSDNVKDDSDILVKTSHDEKDDSLIVLKSSADVDISPDCFQQELFPTDRPTSEKGTQSQGEFSPSELSSGNEVYTALRRCPARHASCSSRAGHLCEGDGQTGDSKGVTVRFAEEQVLEEAGLGHLCRTEAQVQAQSTSADASRQVGTTEGKPSVLCLSECLCAAKQADKTRPCPPRCLPVTPTPVPAPVEALTVMKESDHRQDDGIRSQQSFPQHLQMSPPWHPDISFTCSSPDIPDCHLSPNTLSSQSSPLTAFVRAGLPRGDQDIETDVSEMHCPKKPVAMLVVQDLPVAVTASSTYGHNRITQTQSEIHRITQERVMETQGEINRTTEKNRARRPQSGINMTVGAQLKCLPSNTDCLSQGFVTFSQGFEPLTMSTQMLVGFDGHAQKATTAGDGQRDSIRKVEASGGFRSELHSKYNDFRLDPEVVGAVVAIIMKPSG